MALIAADRVRETTATTGTGAYALAGAVTGFRAFSAVLANADTAYYAATDNVNWEVGLGTYTSVGNTLTRTTILASSNAGSAVSWSAGNKAIFLTYPASKSVLSDAANISGSSTVTLLDTNFTLQDDVDPTKQLQFDAGTIATGTTRTLTAPNASGTLAILSLAQTFTASQTFSSASNTFGASTSSGTQIFAGGATASGNTKSVYLGAGGLAGSTTSIFIGPVAGAGAVYFQSGVVWIPTLTLTNALTVPNGGTGATTLTGYVKGNGTAAMTASATIPNTDITGLGTMSTQAASSVAITGGTITGITDLAVADGGTGASTLTGYVKGNGTAAMTASATIPNTDITGLGTMSTQNASSVAITGGSIQNTTIGGVGVSAVGTFTTLTSSSNLIALGATTLGTANTDTVTANGMVYFVGGTRESVYTVTSTTPNFNPNDGGIVQWNLSGNSTPVSPTNWLNGQSITMRIADGTAYTINWTTMGVVWVGGTAPTLATTGYTIVVLFKIGGVIYGSLTGNVA